MCVDYGRPMAIRICMFSSEMPVGKQIDWQEVGLLLVGWLILFSNAYQNEGYKIWKFLAARLANFLSRSWFVPCYVLGNTKRHVIAS